MRELSEELIRLDRLAPHPMDRDSRQLCRAEGADRIEIQVQLQPLQPTVAASPPASDHLSLEEYTDHFGLPSDELKTVVDYYTKQGLQVLEACARSHVVVLAGSVQQIESIFGVELWLCETRGQQHLGVAHTPQMPALIADQVAGIHGLDHRPVCRARKMDPDEGGEADVAESTVAPSPTDSLTTAPGAADKNAQPPYSPLQIAELYDFPAHSGKGQRISILEFGGGFKKDILKQYFKETLGSDGPNFSQVLVLNAKNDLTSYGEVEVMLDLEILGTLVPEAELTVYFAPNSLDAWAEAMRQAVYACPTPDVISVSWGAVEASWSPTVVASMEKHLKAAVGLGITVCFATGDNGVDPKDGVAQVQYPASSKYVLSCGGTVFLAEQGQISVEVVWQTRSTATGGGISTLFTEVPEWQVAAKPCPHLTTGSIGRGIPDVSGVASTRCAYKILLNDGTWRVECGTSAVAPMWAALVARMNGLLGSRLGFVNRKLYTSTTALRDIVTGSNGCDGVQGYNAGVGWDACTGLGTPHGKTLLEALKQKS